MTSCAERQAAGVRDDPVWYVDHEWDDPSDPTRCVVSRRDGAVRAWVNRGHGLAGYDHAAYHAGRLADGAVLTCRIDGPCEYPGDPRAVRC
jgi:hypothetical protein